MISRPTRVFPARYDWWFFLFVMFVVGVVLGTGIVTALLDDRTAGIIVSCLTIPVALVFWFMLPRRYELWPDRLQIVLGWPVRLAIPLTTITEVRSAEVVTAFVYWGIRFATSLRTITEVCRSKGRNYILSPVDRDGFIESMNSALLTVRARS
ncbi:MAG: hypothetical protein FJ317_07670 [SAR202 cluster bacterium]|nr:hypothetical protein [SAR202 cluster bacterium]